MRVLDLERNEIEALTSITREEAKKRLESGKTVICKVDTKVYERIESPLDLINIINLEKNKIYGKLAFFV